MRTPLATLISISLVAAGIAAAGLPAKPRAKATRRPARAFRPVPTASTAAPMHLKPLPTTATKVAAPAPALAAGPITVTVRPVNEIPGPTILLADIADISGTDQAMIVQIGAVEVGVSPLPGLSRTLMPGDVTVHLRAAHLESKRVQTVLPPGIRVTRIGRELAADEVTKAALQAAEPALKGLEGSTLEAAPGTGHYTLPGGAVKIVPGAWRGRPESGTIYVPVNLVVDGKTQQTVEVALRVHRRAAAVVVARHTIEAHAILTADDLVLSNTELPAGFGEPIVSLEAAIGKRATRRISSDAPLSSSAVETAPAITANDRITIEYRFGSIAISAAGVAHQNGAVGDTIRVTATETHKELEGLVLDSHTVRIGDSAN